MSFTHVGTDKVTAPSNTGTSASVTTNAGTTNDLRIFASIIASTSHSAASLSGGGVTTWTRAVGPFVDAGTGETMDIWYGSVTGAGTSLTVTWDSAVSSQQCDFYVMDFRSSNSGARLWVVEAASGVNGASVTSTPFPNLTSVNAGELYVGFMYCGNTGTDGTLSGFVYTDDPNTVSPRVYNLNLAAATAYQPPATQSPSGAYAAVAAIIDDGSGGAPAAIVSMPPIYNLQGRKVGPQALRRGHRVALGSAAATGSSLTQTPTDDTGSADSAAIGPAPTDTAGSADSPVVSLDGNSPAFVQQGTAHHTNTSSTAAVTLGNAAVVGNRIVVEVGVWSAVHSTCSGVTDSAGNTYTELLNFVASDFTEMSVWSAPVTTGGSVTVTATATANADMGMAVLEYSGLSTAAGSACVDVTSHASGTTSTAATVSSGATAAVATGGELALGFYADSGFNVTVTPGAGLTQRSILDPASDMELLVEEVTVGSGATPNSSFGTGASTVWLASTVVFKAPSGSGTNWTQTPTDTAGSTDSDSLAVSQAPVDTAGSTDSSALTVAQAPVDSAGSTDSATMSFVLSQAPADTAGSTDSAAIGPAPTDTAGSTDSSALSAVKAVADVAGSTDVAAIGPAPTDAAGSTDSANVSFVLSQTPTDPAGTTDGSSLTVGQAPVDAAGSIDTDALTVSQAPIDTAGSTDSATVSKVLLQGATDDSGSTDSATTSFVLSQAPTDPAGATDSSALAVSQGPVDTAGSTDSVATARNTVLTQADDAGSTDSVATAKSTTLTQSDAAGGTDATALSVSQAPADSAGSTDGVSTLRTSNLSFTDDSGSTDSAAVNGLNNNVAHPRTILVIADARLSVPTAESRTSAVDADVRVSTPAIESRKAAVLAGSRIFTMTGVDGGS